MANYPDGGKWWSGKLPSGIATKTKMKKKSKVVSPKGMAQKHTASGSKMSKIVPLGAKATHKVKGGAKKGFTFKGKKVY